MCREGSYGPPHRKGKHWYGRGCGCGCGHGHHFGHRRRFFTKAEKAEKLKSYAEELRKELSAVEDHIKKLLS